MPAPMTNFQLRLQSLAADCTEIQPQLLANPAIAQSLRKQIAALHAEFCVTELCWLESLRINGLIAETYQTGASATERYPTASA
jgi:hypothetical protein